MEEALHAFEQATQALEYSRLPVAVILNKVDIFRQTVHEEPISSRFPAYAGGENVYKAISFFEAEFHSRDRRPLSVRRIHTLQFYVTTATDQVAFAMTAKQIVSFLAGETAKTRAQLTKASISGPVAFSTSNIGFADYPPAGKAAIITPSPPTVPVLQERIIDSVPPPRPRSLPFARTRYQSPRRAYSTPDPHGIGIAL